MKLYILDGGRGYTPDMSLFTPGRNMGKPLTIPFSMYLIDHPGGLVVFDTGFDLEREPRKEGPGRETWKPEQRIDRQMIKLGYKPEDVKFVILSHMDWDHCGCMTLFPRSTFIVRKRELQEAWWPDAPGGRNFNDFKDTRDYKYIQPLDDEDFDVFYDGSLVCIDTRGHTRGHQSLIVNLPKSGKFVLVGDAVQVQDQLDYKLPPHGCCNVEMAMWTIDRLQHMRSIGMRIIMNHDLVQFETLKIAPDYYE